jgi:hypothetical protein
MLKARLVRSTGLTIHRIVSPEDLMAVSSLFFERIPTVKSVAVNMAIGVTRVIIWGIFNKK